MIKKLKRLLRRARMLLLLTEYNRLLIVSGGQSKCVSFSTWLWRKRIKHVCEYIDTCHDPSLKEMNLRVKTKSCKFSKCNLASIEWK